MYSAIIDHYEAGPEKLEGIFPDSRMRTCSGPQPIRRWARSIQQIVIHLLDSDLVWAARMKSIIAEENPIILGYDETKFAERLLQISRMAPMPCASSSIVVSSPACFASFPNRPCAPGPAQRAGNHHPRPGPPIERPARRSSHRLHPQKTRQAR